MGSQRSGYSAANGFACDAPLLRPAERPENPDNSSFLFPLDPPPVGRYEVCWPSSIVGIEAPAALPRASAFPMPALDCDDSSSFSSWLLPLFPPAGDGFAAVRAVKGSL